MKKQHNYTVMHWGTWQVERAVRARSWRVKPVPWDKNPSRIGQSLPDALTSHKRAFAVRRCAPAISSTGRRHEKGAGKEPFVEVSWEVALDLLARELRSGHRLRVAQ
ncbi:hypothetical protein MJ390_09045 [Klebsiella pneumoniae]|nr:hypothetical protein MJ390_09045 [Klebsiella pneumoniae]